jgi:hypothetical protein
MVDLTFVHVLEKIFFTTITYVGFSIFFEIKISCFCKNKEDGEVAVEIIFPVSLLESREWRAAEILVMPGNVPKFPAILC